MGGVFTGYLRILVCFVFVCLFGICATGSALPALADNPIISHVYTADPAARVFNDRVYVVVSHDQDNQKGYSTLFDYYLFSSNDMVNWQDHGIIWNSARDTNWAKLAYAPDLIARNGKYYLYFPNGGNAIGVAVADHPEGPYRDALGHPLIDRNTPNADVPWVFDPAVFIDDDDQAYLYFGGGGPGSARVILLNEDMISTNGEAISIDAPNFFEASYLHKRGNTYYFSYSTNPDAGMTIDYLSSTNPVSGFRHQGTVLANPWQNNGNNNHQSIVEFKGQSYIFYHNRALANQQGHSVFSRSINVDRLYYQGAAIMRVEAGPHGVAQLKTLNAFAVNQAEVFAAGRYVLTRKLNPKQTVIAMQSGGWIKVAGVDFGSGATGLKLHGAGKNGSGIRIILDDTGGAALAVAQLPEGDSSKTVVAAFEAIRGTHDVYLQATGEANLDWYQFISEN